ncbi:hypothetical protein [Phorcysia thermohydrogeniphila]|uniref:hypothetical protein n=1 Tax=Phorcysia thermohydrogeniphila TaxID=936138 RepID=UPI0014041C43|nr:hypothetical protein [Phorcysia thermohydrogeniphila]
MITRENFVETPEKVNGIATHDLHSAIISSPLVEMPEKVDRFCFYGEEFKGRGRREAFIFKGGSLRGDFIPLT